MVIPTSNPLQQVTVYLNIYIYTFLFIRVAMTSRRPRFLTWPARSPLLSRSSHLRPKCPSPYWLYFSTSGGCPSQWLLAPQTSGIRRRESFRKWCLAMAYGWCKRSTSRNPILPTQISQHWWRIHTEKHEVILYCNSFGLYRRMWLITGIITDIRHHHHIWKRSRE